MRNITERRVLYEPMRETNSPYIDIQASWSVDGDKSPVRAVTGVGDICSATFNILQILNQHPAAFYLAANDEAAMRLQQERGAVLIGESADKAIQFSCSNNPLDIQRIQVAGRVVVLKSHNGTVAVGDAYARGAKTLFSYHWGNLSAVADWLQDTGVASVSLIASGGREKAYANDPHLMEDWICTTALGMRLHGVDFDVEAMFRQTRDAMRRQYPDSLRPTEEVFALLLRVDSYPHMVPIFTPQDDRVFLVSNALADNL